MGNSSSSRSKEQMESLFINKKQKETYLSWWKNKSKETCILRIFILSIRHCWREKSHNSAYPTTIPEIKVQREKSYKLQDKKKDTKKNESDCHLNCILQHSTLEGSGLMSIYTSQRKVWAWRIFYASKILFTCQSKKNEIYGFAIKSEKVPLYTTWIK